MEKSCHILWTQLEGELLDEHYQQYLEQLPTRITARLGKYPTREAQYLSLTGKLLLARGLQAYGIDTTTAFQALYYTGKGRPFLEGIAVDFNISHSGNFVVCALSTDCQLGIDIQRRITISKTKASLFISPADLAAIDFETQGDSLIDRWTKREAASKLVGDGLSISFKNMLFNEGNYTFGDQIIFLYPIELDPKYACSLASSKALDHIQVQKVELKGLLVETAIHSS